LQEIENIRISVIAWKPRNWSLECAKLAVEIAWDELFDKAKVQALKDKLAFSTCDPFWAECLVEYEAYLASGQSQPYAVYTDLSEYVLLR
jgi:hypothetical protein